MDRPSFPLPACPVAGDKAWRLPNHRDDLLAQSLLRSLAITDRDPHDDCMHASLLLVGSGEYEGRNAEPLLEPLAPPAVSPNRSSWA